MIPVESIIILLFLGGAWGSFINVVSYRLARKRSFVTGRSSCPNCGRILRALDLIPIISWLILKGRCRSCHKAISFQYWAIEVAMGAFFVYGGLHVLGTINQILYLAVVSFFAVLFVHDLRTYIVPDKIVIPAIAIIFILNVVSGSSWVSLLAGAFIGVMWFLIQFLASQGKWVGGGDIRLGALLGVLLGYPFIFLGLGAAYLGGSMVALVLIALRLKTLKSKIPFATMLLPAAFVIWVWGAQIWQWYVNLIGM